MARRAAPRRLKRRHQHAGIDGNDAALVGEHGIEIELAHLRQVGGKLRELDEEERDGVDVGGRDVAIGLEHARDTRVRAIRSRASSRSSGGSASALSSMTSTAVPPRPNTMTGPKVGSSAMPAISSRAFGRTIIG